MDRSALTELKVGIFVVIGIIVLMISILIFGGDQMFLTSTFSLKTKLPEVQGLSRGSVVSLAGFPIGNVDKIEFEPGSRHLIVTLDIDRDFQNRITEGALASVKTQGALGDKYIFIEPGPLDATPIQEGEFVEASSEGGFLDVITEKAKDLTNLVDVVNEAETLLKSMNNAQIMPQMAETTREMRAFLKESRGLVADLRGTNNNDKKLKQSLTHLANILEKVDRGEGSLGALINDPSLHERLVTILGERPRNKFLKPLIRDSIRTSEEN